MNFHQTAYGKILFERTIPSFLKELRRLNDNLEKLILIRDRKEVNPELESKTEESSE